MSITMTELSRLLKSALGSYPSMGSVDPYQFAKRYHSSLSNFSRNVVQDGVKRACEESERFFPSAAMIARHCGEQKQMDREQDSELSELTFRHHQAERQGDHEGSRELSAAIQQRRGYWRPKSVEEQKADYLAAPPANLTADTEQDETATEILNAHRSYWIKRVQDVATAATSRSVPDRMLATIAMQSVQQVMASGDETRDKLRALHRNDLPTSRKSDILKVAAMGRPANSEISHENSPSIEFV